MVEFRVSLDQLADSSDIIKNIDPNLLSYYAALQAATILVAMASGKNIWQQNFRRKSPIGDLQVRRETCLKNYQ